MNRLLTWARALFAIGCLVGGPAAAQSTAPTYIDLQNRTQAALGAFIVDPPSVGQYPHFICYSGCSGGSGGGSSASTGTIGAGGATSAATTIGGFDSVTPTALLNAIINHADLGIEVHVMNFPGTQPVSGSVSVTGSVNVGNFPTTQPISAAALPLPSGAATATLQSASASGAALESGGNLAAILAALGALQTTDNTSAGYLNTIAAAVPGATPTGSNFIGYVGQQQGGNTQIITASGAAKVDNSGVTQPVSGAVTVSNLPTNYTLGPAGGAINISTAATTQLLTASGSTTTYITHIDFEAAGAGNFTLEYGTGTLCGTGTVAMTGPYNLTAQSGLVLGNGAAPVLKPVPSGNNVCAVTSAAVQISGSILASQQ